MDTSLLLNKKDLAAIFGVTTRCIEKWSVGGLLPSPRYMGRYPFWERESFLSWLKSEFSVNTVADHRRKRGRPRRHVLKM